MEPYRRISSQNFWRIDYLGIRNNPNLILVEHDLIDSASTIRMVSEIKPDEIYNLKHKVLYMSHLNNLLLQV